MEGIRHSTNLRQIRCGSLNSNDDDCPREWYDLDNYEEDPLGRPEITVSFSQDSSLLLAAPLEEPEEDLFSDYEDDVSTYQAERDFEEQVVPSSQLSDGYKEELTILDGDEDEGIFEGDPELEDMIAILEDNSRYDSQPP